MPKMKTKRAAMKRFTMTGSGKIKRNKANKRHILTKKTGKSASDINARAAEQFATQQSGLISRSSVSVLCRSEPRIGNSTLLL